MNNRQNENGFSPARRKFLGALLCGWLLFGLPLAAHAQNSAELKMQKRVWKTFQSAVARNDKTAVAGMMKFPFEISITGADGESKITDEADFVKNYRRIFTAARRRAVARGTISPTHDEEEFNFIMCEADASRVFRFRKIEGVYKLAFTFWLGMNICSVIRSEPPASSGRFYAAPKTAR